MSAVFYLFLGLAIISFAWMMTGLIMEKGTTVHNNLTDMGTISMSTERREALVTMQGAMGVLPIILLVISVILAIMAANEDKNRMA